MTLIMKFKLEHKYQIREPKKEEEDMKAFISTSKVPNSALQSLSNKDREISSMTSS